MFSKEYWLSSWRKFRKIKYLAIMGFLVALQTILNGFRIPVSENLNIMFSYIPFAILGMIVGPSAAMVCGVIADFLGVITSGFGPYFPGYTLSKVLSGLIYGLMLYRQKPTFPRILATKAIINYLINVLLGSLWSSMLYSQSFLYFASVSVVKNTILLPFEALILFLMLKYLHPFLKRRGTISDPPSEVQSQS